MRICEILIEFHPAIFFRLCQAFSLSVHDYEPAELIRTVPRIHFAGVDWRREMTTDAEGRYLDYTGGRH